MKKSILLLGLIATASYARAAAGPYGLATGEAQHAPSWPSQELGAPSAEGRRRPYAESLGGPLPAARTAPDGTGYRIIRYTSPGATAMRLHFSPFHLPPDARLYVYNFSAGKPAILGPFTGPGPLDSGEFWTAPLPGEAVAVELQ